MTACTTILCPPHSSVPTEEVIESPHEFQNPVLAVCLTICSLLQSVVSNVVKCFYISLLVKKKKKKTMTRDHLSSLTSARHYKIWPGKLMCDFVVWFIFKCNNNCSQLVKVITRAYLKPEKKKKNQTPDFIQRGNLFVCSFVAFPQSN